MPSYGFPFFPCVSQNGIAAGSIHSATFVVREPDRGKEFFLPHPDIRTGMIWGNRHSSQNVPQQDWQENGSVTSFPSNHTVPYRIVTLHPINPVSAESNVLCPMSAGYLGYGEL